MLTLYPRCSRGVRLEPSGVKVLLLNYRLIFFRLLAGGCSRGFEVHAPRLRNGVRMQARTPDRQLLTFFASPLAGRPNSKQKKATPAIAETPENFVKNGKKPKLAFGSYKVFS